MRMRAGYSGANADEADTHNSVNECLALSLAAKSLPRARAQMSLRHFLSRRLATQKLHSRVSCVTMSAAG